MEPVRIWVFLCYADGNCDFVLDKYLNSLHDAIVKAREWKGPYIVKILYEDKEYMEYDGVQDCYYLLER
ncbi:MAG: hypothetical protein JZD40_00035 [Sulfolobus sp.]|nr:hypothetical protein [Sulfolobus sp.]